MTKIFSFLATLLFLVFLAIKVTTPASATADQVACTMEYAPVCGYVQVQCIQAPCNPVKQTFGNMCMAQAGNAQNITSGECDTQAKNPKKSPQSALKSGTWTLESFNGKTLTQTGTISFKNGRFSAKLCNMMNGGYTATQSVLIFRRTISTKMYCEGDIMQVENVLASMTRGTYMVGESSLTITTKRGDTIIWKK